jgi:hypothetical protein
MHAPKHYFSARAEAITEYAVCDLSESRLIPALLPEEFKQLEANILGDGESLCPFGGRTAKIFCSTATTVAALPRKHALPPSRKYESVRSDTIRVSQSKETHALTLRSMYFYVYVADVQFH